MGKKESALKTIYECVENGNSLLVFGAGSGLSAKAAHNAGAQMISVYSTSILRMKGINSLFGALPVANANQLLLNEGSVIIQQANHTPCIAGIMAQDPFHSVDEMLDAVDQMGFCGVSNEPFSGIYGEWFSELLEEYGLGFSAEVEMLIKAAERDLLTLGWAFNEEQALKLAEIGTDIIGVMVMDGPSRIYEGKTAQERLKDAVKTVNKICHAVLAEYPEAILITHGDPFYDVETASASLCGTGAVGYASGSSGERVPATNGIISACKEFLGI